MTRRRVLALAAVLAATAAGAALWRRAVPEVPVLPGLDDAAMAARFARPLPPPDHPLRVYHVGHSLVGRDMPVLLDQLAGPGHRHESQLGWGATLKAHWGDAALAGAETENAHPRFRPARQALASGDYDAVILTEMVEIRDALRYHDSARYLARLAGAALAARPDTRLYLYETWPPLEDREGWLTRLDADLSRYWEAGLLRPALLALPGGARIHLIPAGQAMAALVRAVESRGGLGRLRDRRGLFSDAIHPGDMGSLFVALVHQAVLYGRPPPPLPARLRRADGRPLDMPAPELARLMRDIAWQAAQSTPLTGVSGASAP